MGFYDVNLLCSTLLSVYQEYPAFHRSESSAIKQIKRVVSLIWKYNNMDNGCKYLSEVSIQIVCSLSWGTILSFRNYHNHLVSHGVQPQTIFDCEFTIFFNSYPLKLRSSRTMEVVEYFVQAYNTLLALPRLEPTTAQHESGALAIKPYVLNNSLKLSEGTYWHNNN